MKQPTIIQGGKHKDERGILHFNNEFDLQPIRRFHVIEHLCTEVIRSWQGHKVEQKWFQVISGTFKIFVVAPDDWVHPSPILDIQEYLLTEDENRVLHVPGGFVTGIKAGSEGSKLAVFSDMDLQSSVSDSFKFSPDTWII